MHSIIKFKMFRFPLTPLVMGLVLASPSAWALYKVVGPDGKVSYTDRPPAASPEKSGDKVTSISSTGAQSSTDPSSGPLPLALREVSKKFPVVLYTATSGCEPCSTARQFLQQRGIPFTERTATNSEDIEALQRLTGGKDVPTMTVGSQVLRGFAGTEWTQYLDTAGYPATSVLPSSYKPAAATPLTKPRAAPQPSTEASRPAAPAPARPPAVPAPAPGGIRF